jgi:predicted metal-dependent peptidase
LTKEVIKQAVAEAAAQAKQAGKWPAGIKELVDELLGKETINWKQLLRQYIGNKVRAGSKRSWKRESKRFGVLQKGKLKSRMIRLGIAIDTSGSVSSSELQEFMTEIHGIMGSYKTDITILECDAAVQKVYTLKKHMKIDPKFAGRGGTDFRPVFKHFEDNRSKRPEMLIFFTDGEGPSPETETIKTLWVLTTNTSVKTMPFGRVLQIPPQAGKRKREW